MCLGRDGELGYLEKQCLALSHLSCGREVGVHARGTDIFQTNGIALDTQFIIYTFVPSK